MKKPNKRLLHERSHLLIEFPGGSGRAYIPMLENAQVSESQKSNLASYNMLGRNSNLFAYTGSESRAINVTFKISLLHLIDVMVKEGLDDKFKQHFTLFYASKEISKLGFFINFPPSKEQFESMGYGVKHAKTHREYYQKIAGLSAGGRNLFDLLQGDVLSFLGAEDPNAGFGESSFNDRAIDLILFWINLIRSTTKNNSRNTTLGPPIVRLTHGPMYNNVSCVVENYSIRLLDESGFEVQTLLPKQIEVSLSMKETRVGNFSKFKATQIVDGDNNTGWEAVIETNNMDPYNGAITY